MRERIWQRRTIITTFLATIMLLATSQGWSGLAAGPAGPFLPEPTLQDQVTTCMREFELTVRQGPSAGLRLIGTLVLNVERSGRVNNGSLIRHDEGEVRVTGQVNGRAINLIFDLGNGQLIFGVGTLETEIGLCTGAMGGPLVGPFPGDFGDWVAEEGQVVIDSAGRIYTVETTRHDIRFQNSFFEAQARYAGVRDTAGFINGPRLQARFNRPYGFAIDELRGLIYVADTVNQAIRRINIGNGNVTTLVGRPEASAAAGVSTFGVRGVAADRNGNLFISDNVNHVVWFYTTATSALRLLAGSPGQPGRQDGRGTAARFNNPQGVQQDATGFNAIVVDLGNNVIRLVTPQGDVATIGAAVP